MDEPPMIYYMIVQLSYKKNRSTFNAKEWVVSIYDTPGGIMNNDKKMMRNLERRLYGKKYKSQKQIIIKKILEKTPLTRQNRQALK
jgi:hypothetical protein